MTPNEIERLRAIDRAVRGAERSPLFYDILAWVGAHFAAEDDQPTAMSEDEAAIVDWIVAQAEEQAD